MLDGEEETRGRCEGRGAEQKVVIIFRVQLLGVGNASAEINIDWEVQSMGKAEADYFADERARNEAEVEVEADDAADLKLRAVAFGRAPSFELRVRSYSHGGGVSCVLGKGRESVVFWEVVKCMVRVRHALRFRERGVREAGALCDFEGAPASCLMQVSKIDAWILDSGRVARSSLGRIGNLNGRGRGSF